MARCHGGFMLHSTRIAGDPLEYAAALIAANERSRLPDLTGLTIVLPNLGCVSRLVAALYAAAQTPVILLPRFATLESLAADIPIDPPIYSTERRVSDVYHALKARRWVADEDLWTLSREVVALIDAFSSAEIALPSDYSGLLARIRAAYEKGPDKPLGFESSIVFELWHALSHRGDAVDSGNARALQLARFASEASAPLYVVGIDRFTPREKAFLASYARHAEVYDIGIDLYDYRNAPMPRAVYSAAWGPLDEVTGAGELAERIAHIRQSAAGALQNVTLIPARSLEREALNLARVIRHWLACGKQRVAVIALDRLVVRRLRALLARDGIEVSDETGWALSTTRAAAVVMGLASLENSNAAAQIGYLRSALAFAGRLEEHARLALARLDILRARSRRSDVALDDLLEADGSIAPAVHALAAARRRLGSKARPLALWTRALLEATEIAGMRPALLADEAGLACITLLEALCHECDQDKNVFERDEWLGWLESRFEAETFRALSADARVVFTQLAPARLRNFDGVAFAGADDAHLPGAFGAYAFFNDTVRRELGLANHAETLREIESALIDLCALADDVVVSWQATLNGESNPPSRYFNRLEIFHQRVFNTPLQQAEIAEPVTDTAAHGATARPAPTLPAALLPTVITASAYNSLIACPYQFFSRHALGIREPDEEDLSKRDYGILVHRALDRFHREVPVVSELDTQSAELALLHASEQVFRDDMERDFIAHGWLAKWRAQIPAYIAWQRTREAEGWRWEGGEIKARVSLHLPNGDEVAVEGRIDRVDSLHDVGIIRRAVLDYKTGQAKKLMEALSLPGEDVQLPFYALLRPDASEAAYVVFDKEIEQISPEQPLPDLSAAVATRLARLLETMTNGAALPAHGDSISCEYCAARVLCRRDYW